MPAVGDSVIFQVETLEVRERLQLGKSIVVDVSSHNVQPNDGSRKIRTGNAK